MAVRDSTTRQQTFRRRLWQADCLHSRALAAAIGEASPLVSGRVLDVGCGNRPYEGLFASATSYLGLDAIREAGRPDALGLAWALPVRSGAFDTVVSFQTLEHLEEPAGAIAEMARVLRPGGHLVLTAPQAWRVHEAPHDFFRYTPFGLRHLAAKAGLEPLSVATQGGVWTSIASMLNNAVDVRIGRKVHRFVTMTTYLATNTACALLERVWRDDDDANNLLLVARKPDRP